MRRAQLETNLFGVLRVCRAVLPIMRQQGGGTIVNISSVAGALGIPFQGLYSASKFAVEGLSEALWAEARPFGICVAVIGPGDFPTAITARRRLSAQAQHSAVYRERCARALAIMAADERRGPAPVRVARLLERIIVSPAPRLRYTVGPLPEHAAVLLKRLLPGALVARLLMRYYRID